MEILDSETEFDRLSTAYQPGQNVALVETSSEEAEIMDLKKRPSLRGLIANKGKGATPLEAPKTQTSADLPLPLLFLLLTKVHTSILTRRKKDHLRS